MSYIRHEGRVAYVGDIVYGEKEFMRIACQNQRKPKKADYDKITIWNEAKGKVLEKKVYLQNDSCRGQGQTITDDNRCRAWQTSNKMRNHTNNYCSHQNLQVIKETFNAQRKSLHT